MSQEDDRPALGVGPAGPVRSHGGAGGQDRGQDRVPGGGGGPALAHLWAGWRSVFVSGGDGPTGADGPRPGAGKEAGGAAGPVGAAADCVFCRILASGLPDAETHILWRHPGGVAVAILNLYPYTSGHLMVLPTRHVGDVEALTDDESVAVWAGMADAVRALKAAYRPDALNLGANVGKAAGAGVPGHFHLHVVPRWTGDTNFMTAVADTRVLPEAMVDTYRRVRAAWPPDTKAP